MSDGGEAAGPRGHQRGSASSAGGEGPFLTPSWPRDFASPPAWRRMTPHPPSPHRCHLIGTPAILDQGPPCSRATSSKLSTSVMALSPNKAPFWAPEVWTLPYLGGYHLRCSPSTIAAGRLPSHFSSGKNGIERKEPASLWLLCFLET